MTLESGMILDLTYNGKKYNAVVDSVRSVNGRELATMIVRDYSKATGEAYRSMYLDKMSFVHQVGQVGVA